MSTEEVVLNVDEGPRSCQMFCNWCTESFTYKEEGGEVHANTTCPWCKARLKVPRNRLRRLNGIHPGRLF